MTTAKWILCVIAASAISSYTTFHLNQSNQNESGIAPSIENFSALHTSIKHQKNETQELAKNSDAAFDSCNKNINKKLNSQPEKMTINQNKELLVSADNLQLAYEKNKMK